MSIPFRPFQGTEELIYKQDVYPGHVYFATDNGKIFLDTQEGRIVVGGGGVAVLYSSAEDIKKDMVDFSYILYATDLDDEEASPKKDDLILNSDGRFFKVLSYNKDSGVIKCKLLAVSGNGTSSGPVDPSNPGGSTANMVLECTGKAPNAQTYIYGQEQWIEFTPNAKLDARVTLTYYITSTTSGQTQSFSYDVPAGSPHSFDLGSNLYLGENTLAVVAIGDNSGQHELNYTRINSINLILQESKDFNPLYFQPDDNLTFYCMPVGLGVEKTLSVYINNDLAATEVLGKSDSGARKTVTVDKRDHGVYQLKATLMDNSSKATTEPLTYEVAFVDSTNEAPLIWFKTPPEKIVDHDKLSLQFMVYDPVSPNETSVRRYINGVEITELEDIGYSSTEWITWNISNYKIGKNTFNVQCGSTSRQIIIYVEEDTLRNLDIVTGGLYLNLDTLDRSNKENKTKRETWEYEHPNKEVTAVKFNNFNWYNNGWIDDDETGNSILRISNGASIDIPLSLMNMDKLDHSITMELRFRLRNVRKYENLIEFSSEIIGTNEFGEDIVKVTKTVTSTDGVWAKYFGKNIGMCLGTQEGFFKGSSAIASGRYKEDQIVTISFVVEMISPTNPYPLIYMYIDGVMTSIIEYSKSNESFKSEAQYLNINSDYCDVDLLGVRVYKAALSSSEIVQNYLADVNDATLYDMNQIVVYNDGIPTIDYPTMKAYNDAHPDQLLYPYAILECTDKTEDMLPFVKDGEKILNVTFVNPALDKAYNDGKISDEEYLCGAPSFYAENIPFDVQGTSSQGYPRRNYKAKFKKKSGNSWVYTNGPLKDKQIGEKNTCNGRDYKGFYMDNTYSETTFTWKADYMESSMTHNTGFASFVNTLYDFHPLQNYDSSIDVTNRRTTVYGFPMMVFQKTARINEKGEPIYDFIGRYNFNLDKGCNNVIGFEDEHKHPFVEGTFDDDGETKPLDFAHVAECWELKHNQGGRVAFARADFGEVDANNELTVLGDFEQRYNYDKDNIENAALGLEDWESKSQAERNAFLRQKYSNLERLVEWLVSTDTVPVSGEGYVPTKLPEAVTYGEGEFEEHYEYDTREYRLAKFKNEFTKHFNTHYCAIYFIMTEFLIQYDSRGKNMMIGSWGPQEVGGEYIWYPIFYDIDTQLGVNNSGVPSWEYYDEPTKQNEFSTANSVLWNNFYECFYGTITSTYDKLRKKNLTYEKLNGYYSYDPAYILYTGHDNKTHNSYAMKGHRPINVVNVDQYYKYIAPTMVGYINTSGGTSLDQARRFYCLQGNRDLHRELFLRNRFNFMDSVWLGGSYAIEGAKQEFQIRTNANKYTPGGMNNTSDRFLARDVSEAEIAQGFSKDPDNPLNSEWTWNITPYLRQYVSVYYDEILQRDPVEYEGDGNPIPVRYKDVNEDNVRDVIGFGQQLSYIGGAQYISSLGDISLKYPDELYLTELKRLKDIRLGNDTPGYSNNALTTCILGTSAITPQGKPNPGAKQLLETVVLTNVGSLSEAIDITGSEKLKEFRALGTNVPGVAFADGVQLEVLHLPNSITYLELTEPVALQNVLSSPAASGVDAKTGYNIYPKGLYIEGVTDEIPASTTLINKYSIVGGKMGYDSYKLLKQLVDIKKTMQANDELDTERYSKALSVSLKNVEWTPYRLVAYGEAVDSTKSYKKVTGNSTLKDYTPGSDWSKDTLNQLIYEVDPIKDSQKSLITSLEMLDLFLDEENNLGKDTPNYFTDTVEYPDRRKTYPNITGNIFVYNDETHPISEYAIKNHYNVKYPDLKILVNNVNEAYTLNMIEVNPTTGQEIILESLKYQRPADGSEVPLNPSDITVAPSRLHHDFVGWTLDKGSTNVLTEDDWAELAFDSTHTSYDLYAVFVITSYKAHFKDVKTGYYEITEAEYQTNFSTPSWIPSRDEDESHLELKDRIAFKGWTANEDLTNYVVNESELETLLVDPTTYVSEKDYTFFAVFVIEDALEVPTDDEYFIFEKVSATTWKISGNPKYQLSGKITLPITHPLENGEPGYITHIGDFRNAIHARHVFFLRDGQYTSVMANAFYNDNSDIETALQGVYLPQTIDWIGDRAFCGCTSIEHVSERYVHEGVMGYLNNGITHIGQNAFTGTLSTNGKFRINELPEELTSLGDGAFYAGGDNIYFTKLPPNLAKIPTQAFGFCRNVSFTEFGSKKGAAVSTPLTSIGSAAFFQDAYSMTGANRSVTDIYIWDSVKTIGDQAFIGYGAEIVEGEKDEFGISMMLSNVNVYTNSMSGSWIGSYDKAGLAQFPQLVE